jgi:putative ABC transport system ATP-binding protein
VSQDATGTAAPAQVLARMRGISKTYWKGGVPLKVLDGLDLDVAAGDFLALMGPSGSGKSTILNVLGGLDRPDEGEVVVGDTDLGSLSRDGLAAWRARHVGFVFQAFNLIPVLTAHENVELPLLLAPLSRRERRERAEYALEIVGLTDRADHRPKQLSGGQEQRVAIARAIVTDPTMILADEPTGDLDRASADAVMDILQRLSVEQGKTIAMVTHDPLAASHATRLLHLEKGVLVEQGTAGAPKGAGSDRGAARPGP